MCSYYTDGSKQMHNTVWCAFLAVAEDQIVRESQFRLIDGAKGFVAEAHTIHETITDAHQCGFGELDVFSDSKSAIQALNRLVSKHKAVTEHKNLVKRTRVKTNLHWVRAQVGYI